MYILPFSLTGCLEKFLRKLAGNGEIEGSLGRLDRLTQEEARMASAEQLKMTHNVDGKVMGVDDRVRGVEGQVQDVRVDVRDVGNMVQDVDDKLDQANRSSSFQTWSSFRRLRQLHREPAQRLSPTMAFAPKSIH
jgi:hypothetical protein